MLEPKEYPRLAIYAGRGTVVVLGFDCEKCLFVVETQVGQVQLARPTEIHFEDRLGGSNA